MSALDLSNAATKQLTSPCRAARPRRKEAPVKVLLYGWLAEAIGSEVELDAAAGCSVAEVRKRLGEAHPGAEESLKRSRALIGDSAVGDDRVVTAADQVEFLPPVSGG
jgi:molybdopterin converting factor small subunit